MKAMRTIALMAAILLGMAGAQAQNHRGRYNGGNDAAAQLQQRQFRDMQKSGYVWGNVILSPSDKDGQETPGTGVVVTIITEKPDTLYTTVDKNGAFRFFNVPAGKARVTFSMLGYEELSKVVTINSGENKMLANLKPEAIALEGAVVREKVAPVSIKKDTIVFHAAAVKVNKGEMAIDILQQMPGVEVSDSKVTVLNEDVKNVYVDGALLFGEAPMKALNNLAAEEVVTIKSYQEYSNKDPNHKNRSNETRDRVLDIETKSKAKMVHSGNVLLGGGFDTDSTYHKFRYATGGSYDLFSEPLQVHLNANINNINNDSNRRRGQTFMVATSGGAADLRTFSVSGEVTKKWMSPTVRNFVLGSVNARYSFDDNYRVNESRTQDLYFKTDKFNSRETERSSTSTSTSSRHNFSLNGSKSLKDGNVRLGLSLALDASGSNSLTENWNRQDELAAQGTRAQSAGSSRGTTYGASLSARKGFADKFTYGFSSSFSLSDSKGLTAREDSTTSTLSTQVIDISSDNGSRSFSITPANLQFHISESSSLTAQYSFSNSYRKSFQMAYDNTVGPENTVIDTVNTRNYTTDHNTHSASVGYVGSIERIKAILSVMMRYESTGLNRQENFPTAYPYDNRFNSFLPSVSISSTSMLDMWKFSYSSGTGVPSVEQLSPRLDNTNIFSVSAGNPNLRKSRSHSFDASYNTTLGREAREQMSGKTVDQMMSGGFGDGRGRGMNNFATLSVSASFSVTRDPVVGKRVYYQEATYLPLYNYTLPAQATFSSYENADNSYRASFSLGSDFPLWTNSLIVGVGTSMNWDSTPAYVDEALTRTDNYRPSVRLMMRSGFSRDLRLFLNTTASYIYSDNDLKDATSYFTERVNFSWEWNNIFKHLYTGGNYNKVFTQGISYGQMNDNILNLTMGGRFGSRNQFDLSVSAYDLFNKTTGFSTQMKDGYIRNSWSHSFGRHVMMTLSYRFGSFRGGQGHQGGGRGMGGPRR